MSFDRELVEAQLALGLIASSDAPEVACSALEAGLDGPGIRKLAALDHPTWSEVEQALPAAAAEMGLVRITVAEAAVRVATWRVKDILSGDKDPLSQTRELEILW